VLILVAAILAVAALVLLIMFEMARQAASTPRQRASMDRVLPALADIWPKGHLAVRPPHTCVAGTSNPRQDLCLMYIKADK
jgi:hypothetical protein